MARLNVEQSAHTDPRYALLGKAIGRDRWSALGRMGVVWNACQELETYFLTAEMLNAFFDDVENFAEAIVKSGLGRLESDGTIYIAGTRGRIEWLQVKRENGRKGGRPKKNRPNTEQKTETKPVGLQNENPPAPALAPAEEKKEKRLSTQQAGVQEILDLFPPLDYGHALPAPSLVASWIKDVGLDEAKAIVQERAASRVGPNYITQVIKTRAAQIRNGVSTNQEKKTDGHNVDRRDRLAAQLG